MPRALAVLAALGLLVYAFTDFASSDEQDRGDIPRWLWLVIIVILPYFGPISWIAFSRSRRAQAGNASTMRTAGGGPASRGRTRRRASGPVAPDDDPDFLWRLAQEQRRQTRDTTAEDGSAPGDADDLRSGEDPRDDPA